MGKPLFLPKDFIMLIFLIIAKMRMNLFCLLLSENLDFLDALLLGRNRR